METSISLRNGDSGSVIKIQSAYRDVSSLAGTRAYLEHLLLSGENGWEWGDGAGLPALHFWVSLCRGTDGAQGEPEPCLMPSSPPRCCLLQQK